MEIYAKCSQLLDMTILFLGGVGCMAKSCAPSQPPYGWARLQKKLNGFTTITQAPIVECRIKVLQQFTQRHKMKDLHMKKNYSPKDVLQHFTMKKAFKATSDTKYDCLLLIP